MSPCNDNTAQPLTCANCGEVSTNPGQFTPDGSWVCTAVCRDEFFASMAGNSGIPQDETSPQISGNDIADEIEAMNKAERRNDQFDIMAKEIKRQVEANLRLRAALLPFAAAAGRPGRLTDSMTDRPLEDDAVLGLGVKVSAWKKAIELTGAD